MIEPEVKLGLKFSWWVKPCVFALVVTNRILNRLAEKGTEIVPTPISEPYNVERHLIVNLNNQGWDIGTREALFIDWDDGVTTVIDRGQWTWKQYDVWMKAKIEKTPLMRFGQKLGNPVTREEFEEELEAIERRSP